MVSALVSRNVRDGSIELDAPGLFKPQDALTPRRPNITQSSYPSQLRTVTPSTRSRKLPQLLTPDPTKSNQLVASREVRKSSSRADHYFQLLSGELRVHLGRVNALFELLLDPWAYQLSFFCCFDQR